MRSKDVQNKAGGNFLTRKLPGKASSPRNLAFSSMMLVGAGLIVATSAIHSDLWSQSYRAIPVIGNLFLAQALGGVLLALAVIFYRRPLTAIAGIGYMAATAAGLMVSASIALFGFQESLDAPFAQLTLNLEAAGMIAFTAALMISLTASATGRTAGREVSVDQRDVPTQEAVLEYLQDEPTTHVTEEAAAPLPDMQPVAERLVWRPASSFAGREVPPPAESEAAQVIEDTTAAPLTAAGIDETVELQVSSIVDPVQEPEVAGPAAATAGLGGEFEPHERAVEDRERVLGLENPATLTARINLAYNYRYAGRFEEALAVQERVAADSERIHGPDHPYTRTSRANLAELQNLVRKTRRNSPSLVA